MPKRKFDKTLHVPDRKLSRPEKTEKLKQACIDYFCRYMYGTQAEFGVEYMGKRRLDIVAVNLKSYIIGVEIKSGPEDFDADRKWHKYLKYVDRFYFCIPESYWLSNSGNKIKKKAKNRGIGILVLSETTGFVYSALTAKYLDRIDENKRLQVITKMAWRGIGWSKVNRKRRTRRFIEPISDEEGIVNGSASERKNKATSKSTQAQKISKTKSRTTAKSQYTRKSRPSRSKRRKRPRKNTKSQPKQVTI